MMPRPDFQPYAIPHVVGDVLRWPGVRSAHLEHARDVLIWLPPGYNDEPERRYPVLYLHDGQNTLDPATSFAGRDWNVDAAASLLIASDAIEPIIMVAIYNSPDRLREYNPLERGQAYAEHIAAEIMPVIDSSFRTQGGRRNAVMGSSMGGLISLSMLWSRTDHFFGAACLSPSLWVLSRVGGPSAFLRSHAPPPPQGTRLYLDHGTRGAEARGAAFAKETAAFATETAGLKKSAVRYFVARGGEHNEASWGARVDRPLKFLFGVRAPNTRAPAQKVGKARPAPR